MAEDQWERQLYHASWGELTLDIAATQDDASRAVTINKYPHVDGADTDDMGGEPRTTSAHIIFFQRDDQDDYYERFTQFLALRDTGEAYAFVHPLTGTYQARIAACTYSGDANSRDTIMVDCTFVEHTTTEAIFQIGSGAPLLSAVEVVAADAAKVGAAVAAYNAANPLTPVSTTVHTDALATVTAWEATEAGIRNVNLELVAKTNQIAAEMDRLEVATNLRRFPLAATLTNLAYTLRRAAATVTAKTPRLIEITVNAPIPLMALAANTYGADQATFRYEQLLEMNDIENPARIEKGTVLRAQAPGGKRTSLRFPL